MKAVFTGSRDWPYYNAVWDDLWDLAIEADGKGEDLEIYVGDCPTGVDDDVDSWVENHGQVGNINVTINYFQAFWKEYGRAAGPVRNQQMVEAATADGLEGVTYRAYMLNGSAGTANCVGHLTTAGVKGILHNLSIISTIPKG